MTQRRWLSVLAAICFFPPAQMPAQVPDVVRGHVTDAGQLPVEGASISVTSNGSQALRTTRTDRDGRFSVFFPEGEGSYSILIKKVGFNPSVRRVGRTGLSNAIAIEAVLTKTTYALDPLSVTSPRNLIARTPERPSIGGTEQNLSGVIAFLSDPGNLDSLTALIPGIAASSEGTYSVMGASADQNSRLLDGMNFSGGILPPDALCTASFATTTSNASRGGFAGGQLSVQTCRGQDLFQSAVRAALVDPVLSWTDPASTTSVSRIGTWSGFASGAIQPGVSHYRISVSGSQRSTFASSLSDPRPQFLQQIGLSTDTIAAVAQALSTLHVPLAGSGTRTTIRNRTASAFATTDWAIGSTTSFVLSASGSLNGTDGLGLNAFTFNSAEASSMRRDGRLQARLISFTHGLTDELSTVLSASGADVQPYSALPAGLVRVGTGFSDDSKSFATLRFGGSSTASAQTASEWNTRNQFSRTTNSGKHQWAFGQQFDWTRNTAQQIPNGQGTFWYQSVVDLEHGAPSAYIRTLTSKQQSISSITLSAWLSDVWRISKAMSAEGGLRADARSFGSPALISPDIDSLFHPRSNSSPRDFSLSPRFGFALLIHKRAPFMMTDPVTGARGMFVPMDETDMQGGAGIRGNNGAGVTLYGSVGAYHGLISNSLVSAAHQDNGMASNDNILSCVGDATPIPDWSTPNGALFSSCRDNAQAFTTHAQAPVTMLNEKLRAPTDWKLNLGLNGLELHRWDIGVAVTVLREANTGSSIDLNLQRTRTFALTNEAGRPVYALPSAITASSGLFAAGASRTFDRFGVVSQILSDLHRSAAQLAINVTPPRGLRNRLNLQLSYFYNSQHNQSRGFGGTTAGDPAVVEGLSSSAPMHQFVFGTTYPAKLWWLTTGLRMTVSSGAAYTPMVAADINGDGLANDRAFVFDHAPAAGVDLSSLLASAPASARACLISQAGRIAEANSCRGPWRIRLDIFADLAPPQGVALSDRLRITTKLINGGAALMRLIGVNPALVQGISPLDDRLLFVTGFDNAKQQFNYQVNSLFGQPLAAGRNGGRFPPFQLQLGVEYKLGPVTTNANLRKYGIHPGESGGVTAQNARAALDRYLQNPVDLIILWADSIALTATQADQLKAVQASFRARADSAVAPVVAAMVARGAKLTDTDLRAQSSRLLAAIDPLRTSARDQSMAILSDPQKTVLQSLLANRVQH